VGLNVVVHTAFRENAFDLDKFPELVLQSNLFGRGTKNLVLARDLREAYEQIDAELKSVQDIQLSLLPRETPSIPSLELAAYYQTSKRAGGDYYDFFPLPDNQWAILVADVSGHGTPAAVLMAILHAIAHLMPGDVSTRTAGRVWEPHEAMAFVNRALSERYTRETGAFVTMLYGIWNETTKTFRYANAGHPAPVIRARDGGVRNHAFEDVGVPLGILADAEYATGTITLESGDGLVLYTDGITEAFNPSHEMFGEERMFGAVRRGFACCATTHADAHSLLNAPHAQPQAIPMYGELAPQDPPGSAPGILNAIVDDLGKFAGLASRSDDRTLVVASMR
jgi:sigma-B regulation protein RsbU (phosphoserine phosphatase)